MTSSNFSRLLLLLISLVMANHVNAQGNVYSINGPSNGNEGTFEVVMNHSIVQPNLECFYDEALFSIPIVGEGFEISNVQVFRSIDLGGSTDQSVSWRRFFAGIDESEIVGTILSFDVNFVDGHPNAHYTIGRTESSGAFQITCFFMGNQLGGDGIYFDNLGGVTFTNDATSTTIAPTNLTVFRGIQTGGTITDLATSDDAVVSFQPGFILNNTEAPVWIVFESSLATTPATMEVAIEARANTPGLSQEIEAFNFSTGAYEVVNTTNESFNTDSVVTVDLTANISNYVQAGTNAVQTRVGWRRTGFTVVFPWEVQIDHMFWGVN